MIRFDYEATGTEGRLVLLGPLAAEDAPELVRVIRDCARTTPRLVLRVEDANSVDEACLRVIESALAAGCARGASAPEGSRGTNPANHDVLPPEIR